MFIALPSLPAASQIIAYVPYKRTISFRRKNTEIDNLLDLTYCSENTTI